MRITFDRDVCGDLSPSLRREWLETNGLGGFASSTIIGLNTRRYHGLLTAATKPPVGRVLLLSKLEETVILGDQRYDLSANRYPGVIYPQGFQYLKEFRLDPFPVFRYEVDGVRITKHVFMVHGENTTVVEYDLPAGCVLELRPLIAFRDYHATTHRNNALDPAVAVGSGLATVAPYHGLPRLHFAHNAAELEITAATGMTTSSTTRNTSGAWITARICHEHNAVVIASKERRDAAQALRLRAAEIERRAIVVAASPSREPVVRELTTAADQYIVKRGDLKTVIAGYHWFGDWGRDTMIALPGLTLVTGVLSHAR